MGEPATAVEQTADDSGDFGLEFSKATSKAEVQTEIKKQRKPAVVFVTQPWCAMCKNLMNSAAGHTSLKTTLAKFVVVHAEGDDGKQWQASDGGYVPRLFFLDAEGKSIRISGPNKKYSHFFSTADEVNAALTKLLEGDDDFDPDLALDGEMEVEDFDPDLALGN